jgi:hypothetical protein
MNAIRARGHLVLILLAGVSAAAAMPEFGGHTWTDLDDRALEAARGADKQFLTWHSVTCDSSAVQILNQHPQVNGNNNITAGSCDPKGSNAGIPCGKCTDSIANATFGDTYQLISPGTGSMNDDAGPCGFVQYGKCGPLTNTPPRVYGCTNLNDYYVYNNKGMPQPVSCSDLLGEISQAQD